MRERRKEFGWTQKDLGERCEVVSTTISNIESLKSRKPTPETKGLLIRIADELDCEFEYLFPPDYLDALESGKICVWGTARVFIRDVHLDALPPNPHPDLLMPSAEEEAMRNITAEDVIAVLEFVTPRERRILELHYGLGGEEKLTFEEVAEIEGVTKERIRQLEAQAMSRLRHPQVRRQLKDW